MHAPDIFEDRQAVRDQFLRDCGWAGIVPSPVGNDAAFRRYMRLCRPDGNSAILMESVPDDSALATPGHYIADFLRIAAYLREIGLAAPDVYAADAVSGYVLMQDFGDTSFKAALARGADRGALYALAVDVLSHMRRHSRAGDGGQGIALPRYYDSHVHTGRRRLVDWYWPAVHGAPVPDGMAESYLAAWDTIERSLPPVPQSFLHIDFHFENLMLVDGQAGLARCGILDFQGAMTGPAPYDLANLLEDARVEIPADLRAAMLARFCADMDASEQVLFNAWYRVLATQFHCRVIGQFIRLAVRDGKPQYLPLIPRIAAYIRAGLKDPVLAPLAAWCAEHRLDFTRDDGFDPEHIRPLIRDDAF